MMLQGVLLVSMIFAARSETTINNYAINIENNVLRSIRASRESSDQLNLSGLDIEYIEDEAFNNLNSLKILNLSNNSLYDLPRFVFSNLTNLEHLSLADNSINKFTNVFVGLRNLKSLNISNNSIRSFEPGEFYGLTSSVDIFTVGNSLQQISTSLFQKDTGGPKNSAKPGKIKRDVLDAESSFRVKICIRDRIVKQLDRLKDYEPVPNDCREIKTQSYDTIILYLDNLDIEGFERDWYRVETPKRHNMHISLKNNSIVRLSKELLNDLPSRVWSVDLSGNKIERLENGTIENAHIMSLNLSNNRLRDIEDGALQKTKISYLYLNDNRLKDIRFMATLSSSTLTVSLQRNRITELSEDSSLKLRTLSYFYLDGNNITTLRKASLRGFPALFDFGLSNNQITTMEPGCLQNLESLEFLGLRNNRIANIESGMFDGPRKLRFIDLGQNKLTKISENSLPQNISSLMLDFNEIESLEAGSFANMPYNQLSLEGNRIKEIPKGTFNVANQHWVREVDRYEMVAGLQRLLQISLSKDNSWKNKFMTRLTKSISNVDLSRNPIKKLLNGALFGIRKHRTNWIYVYDTPIELIQGGLFDDL